MPSPSTTPRGDEERLAIGLVRGLHGLRGLVRVEILTDNPARFEPGSTLFREGDSRPLTVVSSQRDGPGLLVRFKEISDRNAAESIRDAYLEAAADDSPTDGGFYWHDIVGCAVRTSAGEDLGTVAEVFRVGEGEVYVVRGPRGEILVPAVASIVTELVPAEKRMVVDADALGLNDIDTAAADE
ncbi:MAG TPA: ribosome maturation factor RimM [Candidatus Limnocylindrales bacterium]|nr:ribosome maturation factor RimM [Candidatus Limnocylindrales bacterium]